MTKQVLSWKSWRDNLVEASHISENRFFLAGRIGILARRFILIHARLTGRNAYPPREPIFMFRHVFRLFLVLSVMLPFTTLAADGITLTATVDNLSPRVGERINYTIQAGYTGSLPDITPPDFAGFEIVAGPSVSTSVQIVNMSVSKSQTITYTLRPVKPGTLTINPATIKQRSKLISANPVTVEVRSTANPQTPSNTGRSQGKSSPGQEPPVQGDKLPEVFLTASADKSSLMKLEMAVVTYRLYLRVNVLNYEVAKLPQATGFWIEEFPVSTRPTLEDVTIRGQPYKAATIRKVGVFPTRAGSMILDPMTLDVTVERPARRRSRDPFDTFFDDPFFGNRGQRAKQSVTCDPLTLNVRDFPAGAPADFSGDVGAFDVKVSYDKRELAQNDALTVKVAVSGRGYLKSIDASKLDLPSGFEQYAPTVDDNISLISEAMRGKKTFTYLVIPRRVGNFRLPPVNFCFYDAAAGGYKIVSDGGIELTILPASGREENMYSGKTPSEVTLLDSDIRFVRALSSPLTRKTTPPYHSPIFFILLAVGPVGYLGGIGWEKYSEKRHANPVAVRRRKASDLMRRALLEADKFAAQSDALKAAEAAAKGLAELTGAITLEPTAGLTTELVRRGLEERQAEPDLIDRTVRLLGEADRIRFGGAGQTVRDIAAMLDEFKGAAMKLEQLK